ncbi:MAG: site-2 protease family protein [Phycisphaerales bacterium]
MDRLLAIMATLFDLAIVIAGFSLIILIHELGHFLAARWAGIRVMAFALGFGPAVVSFRPGLGFRRGSSEREYLNLRAGTTPPPVDGGVGRISPTEYRLNVLPLGGYVKMLGQDDADPSARSDEPDSYQSSPPFKRMVVISAGVVCNVILAAVLFVVVFSVGLETEPCKIGEVIPESPAALAVATNASDEAVAKPGLHGGDEVLLIDGKKPDSFKDLSLAAAMARPGAAIELEIARRGEKEPLRFLIVPKIDPFTRMLGIGVFPAASGELVGSRPADGDHAVITKALRARGLKEALPGMRLVEVAGKTAGPGGARLSIIDIDEAAASGDGAPVDVVFEGAGPGGAVVRVRESLAPRAPMQMQTFESSTGGGLVNAEHLLGFMPLLRVEATTERSENAGIRTGDVFIRVGDRSWPSPIEAIAEIQRGGRSSVNLVIARPAASGMKVVVLPSVPVVGGTIGFNRGDSAAVLPFVAGYPRLVAGPRPYADTVAPPPPAAGIVLPENARIVAIDGQPVAALADAWRVLRGAAASGKSTVHVAFQSGRVEATHEEKLLRFVDAPAVELTIDPASAQALQASSWTTVLSEGLFAPELITLRGSNPLASIAMGARETLRAMTSTYLTFARLFQGTVKVEHLKGPVGIAHVGTLLASKGFIWLLFFMAVVSVNLAVVNFLPLPIVDGGQFLFILFEQVTGRQVSVMVQNVAAIGGLLLIGSVFLITTFNDVANLLWR